MAVVKPFRLKTRKCNGHSRTAVAIFLFLKNLLWYDTTFHLQVEKECDLAAGQHLASHENCFSLQSFVDQSPLPNGLVQLNKNIFALCSFFLLNICYILKGYRLQLLIFKVLKEEHAEHM